MHYLLLILGEETGMTPADPAWAPMMAEYEAFNAWLTERGWIRGGEVLQPSSRAATVRVRDGQPVITDGPFAETKEQLGGYYLIEVPTHADALEAAARIPGARSGAVEVRPVQELG